MGISVARISQIEAGDVSTRDVLDRYVSVLGGTLMIIADFGGAAEDRLRPWERQKGAPHRDAPFFDGSYRPSITAGMAAS